MKFLVKETKKNRGKDGLTQSTELLRYAVSLFDRCREGFNERFTAMQLLLLARACKDIEWDFWPDQWTERQIREVIRYGKVPEWKEDDNGYVVPVYEKIPKGNSKADSIISRSLIIKKEW